MAKARNRPCELTLSPLADLKGTFSAGELVAFNAGPDGVVYFAVALAPPDYHRVSSSGTTFAKSVPDNPQTYRVLGWADGRFVLDVVIEGETFNIHDVQPLGATELLLVCGRSHYRSRDDFEKNGRLYSLQGQFLREILLGDGIQSVQATGEGVIWTSYFDEGIFGNFGWHDPIGAPGLIAWDSSGKKLYEFAPTAGLEPMADCYALNVASESIVWCYYYTPFPLVRLRRRKIDGVWKCPVSGSDAFAIEEDVALFRGGYNRHDQYHLFKLSANGKTETIAQIALKDEEGESLTADRVVGRGPSLYLLRRSKLYRIDAGTSANSIGL